jgi:hypothetical protein
MAASTDARSLACMLVLTHSRTLAHSLGCLASRMAARSLTLLVCTASRMATCSLTRLCAWPPAWPHTRSLACVHGLTHGRTLAHFACVLGLTHSHMLADSLVCSASCMAACSLTRLCCTASCMAAHSLTLLVCTASRMAARLLTRLYARSLAWPRAHFLSCAVGLTVGHTLATSPACPVLPLATRSLPRVRARSHAWSHTLATSRVCSVLSLATDSLPRMYARLCHWPHARYLAWVLGFTHGLPPWVFGPGSG